MIRFGVFSSCIFRKVRGRIQVSMRCYPLEARHRNAFFLQAGVLVYFVSLALLVSFSVANIGSNLERNTIALAKPALHSRAAWIDETAGFAQRLESAFGLSPALAAEYAHWILEASTRQDLDPNLLAGLVHAESSFRNSARSAVGAVGPTQIRPEYWGQFCGHPNLRDPEENILCGAQVLAHLRDLCGDETCAVKAYNVGLGSMRGAAAQRYLRKIDRRRSLMAEQIVL